MGGLKIWYTLASLAVLSAQTSAQTFRRTGTCPTLGCIFPPDQTEFIAGQVFDIRIEVQAPANGTEAYNGGVPNPEFSLEIGGEGGDMRELSKFYGRSNPTADSYNFTYFEDLFAEDADTPTLVNVLAKSYRHVTLYNPGQYVLRLKYNGGSETLAYWNVKPLAEKRKAKNVVLFVGDGMSTSMITAARLLGHKSINGKYQTKLALDECKNTGTQMTHSIDSYITDSANSATSLYSGKKATVNGLNSYTDSTGNPFTAPKFETIFEMFRRIYGGQVGIVSTAAVSDATPAAVCAHTTKRGESDAIVDQYLHGVTGNYSWTNWDGPDVLFGGGGADFMPRNSNKNVSQLDKWTAAGYQFVHDNTTLAKLSLTERALGLFSTSTMSTWLDRNIFPETLVDIKQYNGSAGAVDQPGLKEMTLKAVDILSTRAKEGKKNGNNGSKSVGWVLMSEAASIDKAMHAADYDRALGELLEFDDTIRATIQHLKDIGEFEDTLIVVTADHGHGFDVFGSSDTKYMKSQTTNSTRRNAIGTYEQSGLSEYMVEPGQLPTNQTIVVGKQGPGFPVQWSPRYVAAMGLSANVDRNEDYQVHPEYRTAAVRTNGTFYANPEDGAEGFFVSGNLPGSSASGVHSLTDVPVFAWGPGADEFRGSMDSVDIAFKIALALDLGRQTNVTLTA